MCSATLISVREWRRLFCSTLYTLFTVDAIGSCEGYLNWHVRGNWMTLGTDLSIQESLKTLSKFETQAHHRFSLFLFDVTWSGWQLISTNVRVFFASKERFYRILMEELQLQAKSTARHKLRSDYATQRYDLAS